jgi:hypothetical protein
MKMVRANEQPEPLADLMSMTAAARRAGWALARFKTFCERNRLLIDAGGGAERKRFEVRWSEVERALLHRPRVLSMSAPTRNRRERPAMRLVTTAGLHADVHC